ncbi:MAG: DUF885 family protein [Thermoanaerobaculia bacterium]
MGKVTKWSLRGLGVVALAAAVFLVPTIWFKPWSIDHFYGRVFATFALRHPMMLSSMRLLEPMGMRFHNDDLDDMSVAFQKKEAAWLDKQLEYLRSYDRDGMSETEGLSYDILEWFLADMQEANRWMYHDYPVNQLFGIQNGLPDFMVSTHHLGDARDASDYVKRVGQFGRAFEQVMEGLEIREELGITPPKFVIARVLEEVRGLIEPPAKENVLYTHLTEKSAELEGLESEDRNALLAELETSIQDVVYPAYETLISYFEHLDTIATEEDGVWKFPDGDDFYNYQLRHHTTTNLTSEQIHQVGLAEVASLQSEMKSILDAEGYDSENFGATMQALNSEERFLYPDTDEAREQILVDYQSLIDEIDAGLEGIFDIKPEAGVQVKRIPEFRQEGSPGAYYDSPPFDGSKPGTFYVNLRDVAEIPKYGMRTLAYHEAIPGHHFQIGIAQELTGMPFFRRVIPFTAYTEGWALYSERVAAENGFQDDPYDRLGYLQGQIFRAVRLVVDTGIHAQRWTREEAIDYMVANTGMPEGDVVAEIERYIVMPGQACAYMIGRLKMLELRERAESALGDRFSLPAFHNVVLSNGAMPLALLEEQVERWIEEQGGATETGLKG